MINLLGEDGFRGTPIYEGIEKCLALEGSHIHIYGKKETRPFRKMGHATILGVTPEEARGKATMIKRHLRVIA
jgi:5-(carboxyamino)imidazole ribonucleotide synthase